VLPWFWRLRPLNSAASPTGLQAGKAEPSVKQTSSDRPRRSRFEPEANASEPPLAQVTIKLRTPPMIMSPEKHGRLGDPRCLLVYFVSGRTPSVVDKLGDGKVALDARPSSISSLMTCQVKSNSHHL
jgi:hypothetical protein